MADSKEESMVKKRTRSDISSTGSEVDAATEKPLAKNPKKTNSDKSKETKSGKERKKNEDEETLQLAEIKSQVVEINKKLENVMTKNDSGFKAIIKEVVQQMKEELLKSVEHRIDLLESRIFEKEKENDELREEIKKQIKKIEEQEEENDRLKYELRQNESKFEEYKNNAEQYSRANNIRIHGIQEGKISLKRSEPGEPNEQLLQEDQDISEIERESETENTEETEVIDITRSKTVIEETADQTTEKVLSALNKQLPGLGLTKEDIDMCHRIGRKGRKPRQIIIKFKSRLVKERVMRRKKQLPKPVYVTDDLTKLNYNVLMCVRKKQPDDIAYGWSRNGKILYKNKVGNVHRVTFREYDTWLELPWPS